MEHFASLDVGNIFNTIGAYIGIGGTLAGVIFGFKSTRNKLISDDLERSNTALRELVDTKTIQLEQVQQEKHRFEFQLETTKQTLTTISDNLTQGPSIEKLILEQAKQHKQTMRALAQFSESQSHSAQSQAVVASQIALMTKALTEHFSKEVSHE